MQAHLASPRITSTVLLVPWAICYSDFQRGSLPMLPCSILLAVAWDINSTKKIEEGNAKQSDKTSNRSNK